VNPIEPRQLRELVDAYGAALVLYARQWCSSPDDALQEALIDLTQQASAPRDPMGWLFKAVRYKAINLARADQRRSRHWRQAAVERDNWFDCDPTTTMQTEELESMLTELEPLAREIVIARIWGEMSFEQIAELVEYPVSTVHRRYHQTLKLLEQRLNGQIKKN
jgi:RNA polymerase sigma-70 factor (ECF subfamily)